jgi:hypothetical protein
MLKGGSYVVRWTRAVLLLSITLELLCSIMSTVEFLPTVVWIRPRRRLPQESRRSMAAVSELQTVRKILYVVTSLSEYNNLEKPGLEHLQKDRLLKMVVPVMKDSMESMIAAGFEVDLYLILGYPLRPQREKLLRLQFPLGGVNLDIWDDAVPFNYDDDLIRLWNHNPVNISPIYRALSRQHRFVVRDKLLDYDLFVAFEDDMLVKGGHIKHYLYMSQLVEELRQQSPLTTVPPNQYGISSEEMWFGAMSRKQLHRVLPGFIRVEVVLDPSDAAAAQQQLPWENVPLDLDFSDRGYTVGKKQSLDPSLCCNVMHVGNSGNKAPFHPNSSQLMIWETAISGIGVRELPDGSWVGLLNGPFQVPGESFDYKVGKFRADASRNLTDQRTENNHPQLVAQSAGWMMSRRQILELHIDLCKGSFLPPYDGEDFQQDGLWMKSTEYWSGGLQMWQPEAGCNIQRLLSLDPKNFSKHLLYHTANNKQNVIVPWRQIKANHLLGQLNAIRKDAARRKLEVVSRMDRP